MKVVATRRRNDYLEEAIALLIQNQAQFLSRLTDIEKLNSERFEQIMAILLRHERMLEALPETIRQKIGFKPAE